MLDITVIGAGPAGSAAAIRLAQSGHRVRLYEKSRFPRPKLCGGFLSPECLLDLDELGVLDPIKAAGASVVRRTVVSSPWGAYAEAPLPMPGLSLSRDVLDTLLLQRARETGVDVQEGTDGFNQVSNGGWTVVATGRKAETGRYFGVQAFFDHVEGITDQVELDLIPGGYVGFVTQGGRVNLCALTTQENLRDTGPALDAVLAAWALKNPLLGKRLRNARRASAWQAVGPVRMGLQRLTEPQRLFAGDAACIVDPLMGEGIAMGLRTSALIEQAFQQTRCPVEEAYAHAWHEQFDTALRAGAWLRKLFQPALIQDVCVAALQAFPTLLTWLAEQTRPPIYENLQPNSNRGAV
ncbi:MAG: hypothetical protein A2992_09745 [Elusimicrobia bacterium RIFCSPLOWO2_01_FULL_59_12]|nr:MAG: hypothetical protein A2992_09745 [Elusimicrobia bacterium RIFCSPLOWO2_01_FULL_59_12]